MHAETHVERNNRKRMLETEVITCQDEPGLEVKRRKPFLELVVLKGIELAVLPDQQVTAHEDIEDLRRVCRGGNLPLRHELFACARYGRTRITIGNGRGARKLGEGRYGRQVGMLGVMQLPVE